MATLTLPSSTKVGARPRTEHALPVPSERGTSTRNGKLMGPLAAIAALAVTLAPSVVALEPLDGSAAAIVQAQRARSWYALNAPLPQPVWLPVGHAPRYEPVPLVDRPLQDIGVDQPQGTPLASASVNSQCMAC